MSKRLMMNIKGLSAYLVPRILFKNQLNKILNNLKHKNSNELEYIKNRLNYYNNINDFFTLEPDKITLKHILRRASNVGTSKINSGLLKDTSYSYDFYKITKYFDQNLIVKRDFGDCTDDLSFTVTKSRPIGANNVIMKLNSRRHFTFTNDELKFNEKDDKCVFRGACYQANREAFLKKFFNHERVNVGDVSSREDLKDYKGNFLSKKEQLKYKFIISLEGNDVATNLKWILASNSIALTPKLEYETWFMEGRLVPNEHFALLNDDYSNLFDVMDNLLSNENLAKNIIKNANDYAKVFFDEEQEKLLNILVLAKYFYFSNQMKFDDFIIDIFKK